MKAVDVMASGQINKRASVLQGKTQKLVRFEISEDTRTSVEKWMEDELMVGSECLRPCRFHERLMRPGVIEPLEPMFDDGLCLLCCSEPLRVESLRNVHLNRSLYPFSQALPGSRLRSNLPRGAVRDRCGSA